MRNKAADSSTRRSAPRPQRDGSPALTQSDMVLVSFHRVAGGATTKVPYEELVLQAWRDFPQAFSLRNHPEHPDASDIHKKLYQTLKPAGHVVSLGNKVFRLTDKGVTRASELLAIHEGNQSADKGEQTRLSRSEETFVGHALRSRALSTWREGQSGQLIDYDARMFFQFSTGTPIEERKRRVQFSMDAINKARDIGVDGADDLVYLADHLVQRFDQLLKGQ